MGTAAATAAAVLARKGLTLPWPLGWRREVRMIIKVWECGIDPDGGAGIAGVPEGTLRETRR